MEKVNLLLAQAMALVSGAAGDLSYTHSSSRNYKRPTWEATAITNPKAPVKTRHRKPKVYRR